MLEDLKKEVLKANQSLVKNGLVIFTWGNASGIDMDAKLVAIKPSGVEYEKLTAADMVVVDLDGNVVEGSLRPSSDTPTHLELYKAFPQIGGIVHTHSAFATAWAQSCRAIPVYGTTHADYFYGDIPCARLPSPNETEEYEKNTGKVIAEEVKNPGDVPACLVAHHGLFAWGKNVAEAVYHATVAEEVAKLAYFTETLGGKEILPQHIAEKHYGRKHGKNSYYGQK